VRRLSHLRINVARPGGKNTNNLDRVRQPDGLRSKPISFWLMASASSFLPVDTIENCSDTFHVIETRNLVVFGAVVVGERQSVHFVVDVGDRHIGLVANDVLTKKAGVNMSVISRQAASTTSQRYRQEQT
jgi:hypothetical protein